MTRTSFCVDLGKYVGPEAKDQNIIDPAKMKQVICFFNLVRFGTDLCIFPWRNYLYSSEHR